MTTAAVVLNIARSHLGYSEGPRDNETPFGAWAGCNLQPWCCAFTSWCLDQAALPVGKVAYCPAAVQYWKEQARLFSRPQEGDCFFLYFPSKRRYAHTGFVEKVDGDRIVTIEGNSNSAGSRTGGQVVRLRRRWAGTRTVFGRPAYTDDATSVAPTDKESPSFNPAVVTQPIIADLVPEVGGIVLIAHNGDTYAFAGASYPGPMPGHPPAYGPLRLEPLVDARTAPEGGAQLLAISGAVYAFGGAPYHGGPNGQEYFKGRMAAHFGLHPSGDPSLYSVIATSGETYSVPFT
jgi:hypothetical protein